MSDEPSRPEFWEERWARALREHPDAVANRPPNAHLVAILEDAEPGRALDAGCGHGSEALWLAARGWHVTAVDFSAIALEQARARAEVAGADVAARIDWVQGDLAAWSPPAGEFDLVTCIYVHAAGSVAELVTRLATGVAPGGSLVLVGNPSAPGQRQVAVDDAREALRPPTWQIALAEERPRGAGGIDAVIHARRSQRG